MKQWQVCLRSSLHSNQARSPRTCLYISLGITFLICLVISEELFCLLQQAQGYDLKRKSRCQGNVIQQVRALLEFQEHSIGKNSLAKLVCFSPFSFSHFSSNLLTNVLVWLIQITIIPRYYSTMNHLHIFPKHMWFTGSILCLLNSIVFN